MCVCVWFCVRVRAQCLIFNRCWLKMQECFLSLVPQHTCSSGEREMNGTMDTFGWTDVWKHRRRERGIDDRLVEWMDEQLA